MISFNGFDIYRDRDTSGNSLSKVGLDSVIIKINFQDGDGDLGLDSNTMKTDTIPNFVLHVHPKNKSHTTDTVTYTGQFRPLDLSARND